MSYSITCLSIYINSWDFRNEKTSCMFLGVICESWSEYVTQGGFFCVCVSILSADLFVSDSHLLLVPVLQIFPLLSRTPSSCWSTYQVVLMQLSLCWSFEPVLRQWCPPG